MYVKLADVEVMIYLRISQDRAGDELGIARQREDAYALAARRNWTVVGEYVDNDTSASGRQPRPAFKALLRDLEAGKARGVIAWDFTRLARSARDRFELIELGKQLELTIAPVRGSEMDLSTPGGRLTAGVLGEVAQHEIDQKSDRQRRAAQQAAEQGRRIGGRRPFGYEPDGMTIREVEAQALREAYAGVLTGVPLGRIAREWNEKGLRTPQHGHEHGPHCGCDPGTPPRQCPQRRLAAEPSEWEAQTLGPTLLNPRYAGLLARGSGRARTIVGTAQWPGVVEESMWRAAAAILSDPGRASLPRTGQALLTGIGRCGVCRAPVHSGAAPSRKTTKGKPGWRTYRCSASFGHVGRAAEPVEVYVSDVVLSRLARSDAHDLLIDHERVDVNELRDEVEALRSRRRALVSLAADGTFTEGEVRTQAAKLAEKIAEVEAQLVDAGRVDVLGPLVDAADMAAVWVSLGTDRQRAVIDSLMVVTLFPPGRGTRTFRPETVGISWRLTI